MTQHSRAVAASPCEEAGPPAGRSRGPSLARQVVGQIVWPDSVIQGARRLAQRHYQSAEDEDFSGTEVGDYLPEEWFEERWKWFPFQQLRELGWEPVADRYAGGFRENIYATVGVDEHIDDIHGVGMIAVLHNDGIAVHIGTGWTPGEAESPIVAKCGDWFLLDDRNPHEARETELSTTLVIWSVPLQPILEATSRQQQGGHQ